MKRIVASELSQHVGERVTMAGWLHNLRRMGRVNFLLLRDRTGLAQAVLGKEDLAPLEGLQMETVLEVSGNVVEAPPAPLGLELHGVELKVVSPVADTLPFELNQPHLSASLPVFLDHATVGQRHPRQRATLRIAAGIAAGFRRALDAEGFTEIFTPKIVASATESGANVFQLDYFGQPAYLAQSPQFYKQIMVGVFEQVYEVGPVFRAEPHATTRHVNEYVSLDAEMGFIEDHFMVMDCLTRVMRTILAHLTGHCADELKMLEVELPQIGDRIPWIYFPDAQDLVYRREGIDARGEPDLAPEHERALGQWANEEFGSDFLFVTGYPMAKRPFYTHPNPTDPAYSNSFDLLFRGMELVTGGQRLHIYDDYCVAAEKAGLSLEPYQEYLECFKYGMPPHGGFAIGLERFVAQLLQAQNLRWANLFPRDLARLKP
ncbi:MAG TPA: aspartate--tRNA(Asn) ligase [Anaerolineae bacterium]|nr:aspartate--tRNA(Asn) ligase [Anaerolineae bacterium]